jgi:hypothetical protein
MDAAWAGVIVGATGAAAAFYAAWKASKNAEAALAHTVKMSEHELRAYVFLKEAKMGLQKGAAISSNGKVTYQYHNFGRTPAKSVRVAARAIWDAQGAVIDEENLGAFREVGPLAPDDELDDDIAIEGAPQAGDIVCAITQGGCAVHLIGCIKYSDQWSGNRETSFHFYVGGDAGWDEFMHAAINGNDYK